LSEYPQESPDSEANGSDIHIESAESQNETIEWEIAESGESFSPPPSESNPESFSQGDSFQLDNQDDSLKVSATKSAESRETFSENEQTESAESFKEEQIETFIYKLPIDVLIDRIRNWYRRRHNTAANMRKYETGKIRLEKEDYTVDEVTNTKLSITQQIEKTK